MGTKKYLLLACDFSRIEWSKKYCAEVVKLIAAAYVGRLRELYDYHELIETDYFSNKLVRDDYEEELVK